MKKPNQYLAGALLAAGDGVIAEGVLLAAGALVARLAGDIGCADAVTCLLVARGRGRTCALQVVNGVA